MSIPRSVLIACASAAASAAFAAPAGEGIFFDGRTYYEVPQVMAGEFAVPERVSVPGGMVLGFE